ncbi:hypothetical protein SAMD00019534_074060, partial [Acytostelium subglobosum LB1]|uniref:hypothetical protein n=1 Tax=Acytostelium subglobosum LB1 TaxID=1410327 RepID=UPI0006451831
QLLLGIALISVGTNAQPSLSPQPQSIEYGQGVMPIDVINFSFNFTFSGILYAATDRYEMLFFMFGNGNPNVMAQPICLQINVESDNEDLYLGVDESYEIMITNTSASIEANTVYGAIRALETFSQLIVWDQYEQTYNIPYTPITIKDFPRFPYRGILVDSARHFLPVDFVMHVIDALAYNKFNTMHWHIVDAQSFPVQSTVYPNLTKGAFNPVATYSHSDISQVVSYAKDWGIRVIPEFDVPAHSGSWGIGYPELVINCSYPSTQNNMMFNVALPSVYTFLGNFFKEMRELFIDQYYHLGGDEAPIDCWGENPQVAQWMADNGFNSTQAEQYFEDHMIDILNGLNGTKLMVWDDLIANGLQLPVKDTIIEVWGESNAQVSVDLGYQTVMAYQWYLDQQIPDNVEHDEYEDTWQTFYQADPLDNLVRNQEYVIGGEACMFAEQVNMFNWDGRVFPRSIAIAERLWSDQSVTDINDALNRFNIHSCRLATRSVASGPLQPSFCLLPPNNNQYRMKPIGRPT